MEFIKALERIRQNCGMTDGAFAEQLHIGRSTWQSYKDGRPYPIAFMQVAVEVYPQLRGLAEAFFAPRNTANAAKMLQARRKARRRLARSPERQVVAS